MMRHRRRDFNPAGETCILLFGLLCVCLGPLSGARPKIEEVQLGNERKLQIVCIENQKEYCSHKPDKFVFNDGCRECQCKHGEGYCKTPTCVSFVALGTDPEDFCQKLLIESESSSVHTLGNDSSKPTELENPVQRQDNESQAHVSTEHRISSDESQSESNDAVLGPVQAYMEPDSLTDWTKYEKKEKNEAKTEKPSNKAALLLDLIGKLFKGKDDSKKDKTADKNEDKQKKEKKSKDKYEDRNVPDGPEKLKAKHPGHGGPFEGLPPLLPGPPPIFDGPHGVDHGKFDGHPGAGPFGPRDHFLPREHRGQFDGPRGRLGFEFGDNWGPLEDIGPRGRNGPLEPGRDTWFVAPPLDIYEPGRRGGPRGPLPGIRGGFDGPLADGPLGDFDGADRRRDDRRPFFGLFRPRYHLRPHTYGRNFGPFEGNHLPFAPLAGPKINGASLTKALDIANSTDGEVSNSSTNDLGEGMQQAFRTPLLGKYSNQAQGAAGVQQSSWDYTNLVAQLHALQSEVERIKAKYYRCKEYRNRIRSALQTQISAKFSTGSQLSSNNVLAFVPVLFGGHYLIKLLI